MDYLTAPLTIEAIRAQLGTTGTTIRAVIRVDLADLIAFDIDDLNDYADEQILPDHEDLLGCLTAIAYEVVGFLPSTEDVSGGAVLLQVDADVEITDPDDGEAS